jgi:tRNA (cmo5U34)-methyltransferase
LYWNHWLTQVREKEPSEKNIQESINRRTAYDRDAPLADQLRWLEETGFTNVDCVYKNYFVGVFLAMKE